MRGIMAIFDPDETYAVRFMQYAGRRKLIPFEIQAFTEKEKLARFMAVSRVEILLTAEEGIPCAEGKKCLVVRLGNDGMRAPVREGEDSLPSVSRYQSVSAILREVMRIYEKEGRDRPAESCVTAEARTRLIGVYSPAGGCGKTSFALTLGLLMAKEKPTLYLNFEPFSGLEMMLGKSFSADVTDILYLIKTGRGSVPEKMESIITSVGDLAIVPPAGGGTLSRISVEEWEELLKTVQDMGSFRAAVIDFAEVPDLYPGILRLCDAVYMPAPDDAISQAKIHDFESSWQSGSEGADGLLRKVAFEDAGMPDAADNWPFVLPYTRLGSAAAYVIRRDGL